MAGLWRLSLYATFVVDLVPAVPVVGPCGGDFCFVTLYLFIYQPHWCTVLGSAAPMLGYPFNLTASASLYLLLPRGVHCLLSNYFSCGLLTLHAVTYG